jgi:heme-degrading monooxygenase HmoA
MIVRILQLNVRPDRIQQFLEVIAARVQQGVQGADGLLGWEVLAPLEQPPVTVVITRWRDEDAVRTWAGPFWRQRPVGIETDLANYLAHSSVVSHYVLLDAETIT